MERLSHCSFKPMLLQEIILLLHISSNKKGQICRLQLLSKVNLRLKIGTPKCVLFLHISVDFLWLNYFVLLMDLCCCEKWSQPFGADRVADISSLKWERSYHFFICAHNFNGQHACVCTIPMPKIVLRKDTAWEKFWQSSETESTLGKGSMCFTLPVMLFLYTIL